MGRMRNMPLLLAAILVMSAFVVGMAYPSTASSSSVIPLDDSDHGTFAIGETFQFDADVSISGVYGSMSEEDKMGSYTADVKKGETWETEGLQSGYYKVVEKRGFLASLFRQANYAWLKLGGPIEVSEVMEGTIVVDKINTAALGDTVVISGSTTGFPDGTPINVLLKGKYKVLAPITTTVEDGAFNMELDTAKEDLGFSTGSYRVIVYYDNWPPEYQSTDIHDVEAFVLLPPTMDANLEDTTITTLDGFVVSGTTTGSPDEVEVWLMGRNLAAVVSLPVVENAFEYALTVDSFRNWFTNEGPISQPENFKPGTYTVMIVDPCTDDFYRYDDDLVATGTMIAGDVNKFFENQKLTMNKDITEMALLDIEYPEVTLSATDAVVQGDDFVIGGTTNMVDGTTMIVHVEGKGVDRTQVTDVKDGSFDATFEGTKDWPTGDYLATVEDANGILYEQMDSKVVMPAAAPEEEPEEVEPEEVEPEEEPEEEETPGFGAVISIAGLLSVAYLVVRRRR